MDANRDSLLDNATERDLVLDRSGANEPLMHGNISFSQLPVHSNSFKLHFHQISGNVSELKPANNLDPNDSSLRFDLYHYFGKSVSAILKPTSEASICKQDQVEESSKSEEQRIFTAEEQKTAFMRQVGKIKYFWRGTNLSYPFAFHKFLKICKRKRYEKRLLDLCEKSRLSSLSDQDDGDEQDHYLLLEDYSNKLISPAEKLLK